MTSQVPVVLAGGSGTRLWPASRAGFPKQFLSPQADGHSLFQQCLLRAKMAIPHASQPIIICLAAHRFIVAAQCQAIGIEPMRIVLEPRGRNTAPSVALAAAYLQAEGYHDANLWVLPADHALSADGPLRARFALAAKVAAAQQFMVFGVRPSHPSTAYGYIKVSASLKKGACAKVDAFIEKPDIAHARSFLEDGGYYFNSGMFVYPLPLLLQALTAYAEGILVPCQLAVKQGRDDLDFFRIDPEAFLKVPAISIDYALMEKTPHTSMVLLDSLWSDLGSWDQWSAQYPTDTQGNVIRGKVEALQAEGCYLQSDSRLLAVLGVKNLLVVDTPDAVLVADKKHAQHVGNLVQHLRLQSHKEADKHSIDYRPWGSVEHLCEDQGYHVKRLCIAPQQGIALQRHHHRSEHWVIVAGEAEVTLGGKKHRYQVNESISIPSGETHALTNPGRVPLVVIEMQTGSSSDQDDIERLSKQSTASLAFTTD